MGLGLTIGRRGLLSAQTALETIGHNVSNANTEGYSRQSLDLSTTQGLRRSANILLGTGVEGVAVTRTVDELLNRRLLLQTSSLGRLDGRAQNLSQVETILNAGGEGGINSLLQGFFDSVSALSTAPEDLVLRTGLVQSASEMSDQLNSIGLNLVREREGARDQIESHLTEINEMSAQISEINRDIVRAEAGQLQANDLRDRRDQTLRELSDLIDIQVFENEAGAVRVLASGSLLVHPSAFNQLEVVETEPGQFGVRVESSTGQLTNVGGRIGGLLEQLNEYLPEVEEGLNQFVGSFVHEINKLHSTGVPADGPMTQVLSTNSVFDQDFDGDVRDELLAGAGLPFEVEQGRVLVNLVSEETGAVETTAIEIDPTRTTVGDFVDTLSSIPNLAASLDVRGRVNIVAANGFGFDFSRRLDPNPDSLGTFGGNQATLGAASGPYVLSPGDTLQLQGPSGNATVTFAGTDFEQISAASAAEVAAAINADPNVAAAGILATTVGDQLFLQTQSTGTGVTLTVNGGSATGALGLTAGASTTGHDQAVTIQIGGQYEGTDNDTYRFRPLSDGTIGTTPGLQIEVRNAQEQIVAVLEVGAGYVPGDEISIGEGVTARFGFGEVSATDADRFDLEVTSDSDTSDVLAALGINAFFTGTTALDVAVRSDIQADPSLVSTSGNGSPGDGGALLQMLGLQQLEIESLGGVSLPGALSQSVNSVGLELSSVRNTIEAEQFLLDGLTARHDELTGVNVDEELVNLIEFEQAFQAASRFIQVMSDIGEEVLTLV